MKRTFAWRLTIEFGALFSVLLILLLAVCIQFIETADKNKRKLILEKTAAEAAVLYDSQQRDQMILSLENISGAKITFLGKEDTRPEVQNVWRGQPLFSENDSGEITFFMPLQRGGQTFSVLMLKMAADANGLLGNIVLVAIITLFFALALILWRAYLLEKPVRQFKRAIECFANGEDEDRVLTDKNELGELLESFYVLRDSITAEQKSRAWLVASISHDLRTPLTSIKGFVNGIKDGIIKKEDYPQVFQSMEVAVSQLIRLTGDMLEVAKVESGQLKLFCEYVNLSDIVGQVVNMLGRPQTTILNLDETIGVYGDTGRLKQVFTNIIDNAYKYNRPGGKIIITVRLNGKNAEALVHDTGFGISKEDCKHIFEKFYRAVKPGAPYKYGSGIGLYVAKTLLNMHGGDIRVESELNVGTTFISTIPAWMPKELDGLDESGMD